MKALLATLLVAASTVILAAQTPFPGLAGVLTPEEWQRAGLDRLSPDEIGVIDAALIRHGQTARARLQEELAAARAQAAQQAQLAAQQAATQAAQQAASSDAAPERKRHLLARFGLPVFDFTDWRDLPPLRAKVVAWENRNRFRLDNGQVWEGFEPIPYDLPGRDIEIHARPNNQFALVLDGKSTSVRLFRLR